MDISLRELPRAAKSSDPTKLSRAVMDLAFFPFMEEMYSAALELCAGSDVVVGHFSTWPVKAAAVRTGVPFAAVHYYPGLVPSRYRSPPALPRWRWFIRPGWALMEVLINIGFRGPAAKFFAQKGLKVRNALREALLSDRLNLLAASPAFWPPPPDWGDVHRICGDFTMPEANEPWQPSAALRAFLDAGEPPVMISLGSMEHLAPERARQLVIAAARLARVRAIIQTKTERHRDEGQDGALYFLPWAPHRPLLPLCSAMVHHGGAGTTHSALRAGKPSVVLPFIFEQKLWATQLERVGGAGRFLSFWKATPEQLAARIHEATGSDRLRLHTSALAAAMAGEDGTGTAARLLERLAEAGSRQ
jgi:UDP:flavonoid glycosyltransferase YjiC (YdhE family)